MEASVRDTDTLRLGWGKGAKQEVNLVKAGMKTLIQQAQFVMVFVFLVPRAVDSFYVMTLGRKFSVTVGYSLCLVPW